MKLGQRKLQILQAIIDDYILSAEPVGSRTLAKRHDIGISSATIRNEMADLEDMGYLEQPHTSAGRIPSDKAYRLYVDQLMKIKILTKHEADNVKSIYENKIRQMEQVIVQTAKVLSDITNYTSLVLKPQLKKVFIRHIQLVPVDKEYALLVIVTSSGIIKDTIIRIPEGIDADHLNRISNIITANLKDKSFHDADTKILNDIKAQFIQNKSFFNSLVDALTETFSPDDNKNIVLGGTTNIFNFPEYHDIIKAKTFLGMLEEKDILFNLLNKAEEGVTVSIGNENPYEEIKHCSIVTATYKVGDRILGSIGVIGPTRMEYAKAVSVMDYMGKTLTQYLTTIYGK